jgi:pyrroline-5-carboxylate reductase
VISILAATPLQDVKAAYPDRPVYRILPSTPVAVRQGAVILAADDEQDAELDGAVRGLLEELGTLVVLDDAMVDVAMGLMSNAPAYYALVVEAQVDAGVRHGLTADQASRLVVQTMAGTAELLRRQGFDTLAARRAVTSPGGSTARGLDALERGGLRAAFSDALDAILRP